MNIRVVTWWSIVFTSENHPKQTSNQRSWGYIIHRPSLQGSLETVALVWQSSTAKSQLQRLMALWPFKIHVSNRLTSYIKKKCLKLNAGNVRGETLSFWSLLIPTAAWWKAVALTGFLSHGIVVLKTGSWFELHGVKVCKDIVNSVKHTSFYV